MQGQITENYIKNARAKKSRCKMKKAIIYSTTTGNTQAMAEFIKKGAEASGSEVYFATADSCDAEKVLSSDVIILGSPAMGAEELEDSMENFYTAIESKLSGKKVAIFGSYDWGDGEWLRIWKERLTSAGAVVVNGEGLSGHLFPDEETSAACEKLGIEA